MDWTSGRWISVRASNPLAKYACGDFVPVRPWTAPSGSTSGRPNALPARLCGHQRVAGGKKRGFCRLFLVLPPVALASFGLLGTFAQAQTQRSGGNNAAAAALMQQYQQVSSERTQLKTDNDKLKKQVEDLKKQLTDTQKQVTASKAGADRGQAAITAARSATDEVQKKLDDSNGRLQEVVNRYRDTVTTMRDIETDRNQLKQQLAQSHSEFDACAKSNDALYRVDTEVLDLYEHQGMLSYMQRAEPFTRLKRTEVENLSDRYRQRAEELRVKATVTSQTAPGTAAPAATSQAAPAASAAPSSGAATPTSGR